MREQVVVGTAAPGASAPTADIFAQPSAAAAAASAPRPSAAPGASAEARPRPTVREAVTLAMFYQKRDLDEAAWGAPRQVASVSRAAVSDGAWHTSAPLPARRGRCLGDFAASFERQHTGAPGPSAALGVRRLEM